MLGLFALTSWFHCAKAVFLLVVSFESGLKFLILKMQENEIISETEFAMANEDIENYAPFCYLLLLVCYKLRRSLKVAGTYHEDVLNDNDEKNHNPQNGQQIQSIQQQLHQLQQQQQHGFEQIQNLQENGHEYLQQSSPQQYQLPVRASTEAYEFDPTHLEMVSPSPTRTHTRQPTPRTSMSNPEHNHFNAMTQVEYIHPFATMPIQRYNQRDFNTSLSLQPRQLNREFLPPYSSGENQNLIIRPHKPIETPPSKGKEMSSFFKRGEYDPTFDVISPTTRGPESPNMKESDNVSTLSEEESESSHNVAEQLRKNHNGKNKVIEMSDDKKRKAECIEENDNDYYGSSEVDDESNASTPSPNKKRRQSSETI